MTFHIGDYVKRVAEFGYVPELEQDRSYVVTDVNEYGDIKITGGYSADYIFYTAQHFARVNAAGQPIPAQANVDYVNHPPHYKFDDGVEVIALTEQLNFNTGNAVKYLARAGRKTTDGLQDLEKAEFYVKREIERVKRRREST